MLETLEGAEDHPFGQVHDEIYSSGSQEDPNPTRSASAATSSTEPPPPPPTPTPPPPPPSRAGRSSTFSGSTANDQVRCNPPPPGKGCSASMTAPNITTTSSGLQSQTQPTKTGKASFLMKMASAFVVLF